MEISKLADKILECLDNSHMYSELTNDSLKDILCYYLSEEYNKKISRLSIKFDLRIMSGEHLEQSDYDEEFEKIKTEIMEIVNDLARVK